MKPQEPIKNSDWWDDLSENQQEQIHQGLDDAKNGRIVSSEDFWRILKNANNPFCHSER